MAPTRFGIATSQNSWLSENAKPTLFRFTVTIDQITHTENPRCSARIEKTRLRRATLRPPPSQNAGSSGSQWSIQRPGARSIPGGVPAPVSWSDCCSGVTVVAAIGPPRMGTRVGAPSEGQGAL